MFNLMTADMITGLIDLGANCLANNNFNNGFSFVACNRYNSINVKANIDDHKGIHVAINFDSEPLGRK